MNLRTLAARLVILLLAAGIINDAGAQLYMGQVPINRRREYPLASVKMIVELLDTNNQVITGWENTMPSMLNLPCKCPLWVKARVRLILTSDKVKLDKVSKDSLEEDKEKGEKDRSDRRRHDEKDEAYKQDANCLISLSGEYHRARWTEKDGICFYIDLAEQSAKLLSLSVIYKVNGGRDWVEILFVSIPIGHVTTETASQITIGLKNVGNQLFEPLVDNRGEPVLHRGRPITVNKRFRIYLWQLVSNMDFENGPSDENRIRGNLFYADTIYALERWEALQVFEQIFGLIPKRAQQLAGLLQGGLPNPSGATLNGQQVAGNTGSQPMGQPETPIVLGAPPGDAKVGSAPVSPAAAATAVEPRWQDCFTVSLERTTDGKLLTVTALVSLHAEHWMEAGLNYQISGNDATSSGDKPVSKRDLDPSNPKNCHVFIDDPSPGTVVLVYRTVNGVTYCWSVLPSGKVAQGDIYHEK